MTSYLTSDERRALREFAAQQGRSWKTRLMEMWIKDVYYGTNSDYRILRILRTASYFGPAGLMRIKRSEFE